MSKPFITPDTFLRCAQSAMSLRSLENIYIIRAQQGVTSFRYQHVRLSPRVTALPFTRQFLLDIRSCLLHAKDDFACAVVAHAARERCTRLTQGKNPVDDGPKPATID